MGNAIILYASMTGNTARMAEEIAKQLETLEVSLTVKNFNEDMIAIEDFLNYDMIFMGVYTWSAGDIPFETEDFFDQLPEVNLKDKICAVFGSADKAYGPLYGLAVTIFYEALEKQGATMVSDPFITDLQPDIKDIKQCRLLVDEAYRLLVNVKE